MGRKPLPKEKTKAYRDADMIVTEMLGQPRTTRDLAQLLEVTHRPTWEASVRAVVGYARKHVLPGTDLVIVSTPHGYQATGTWTGDDGIHAWIDGRNVAIDTQLRNALHAAEVGAKSLNGRTKDGQVARKTARVLRFLVEELAEITDSDLDLTEVTA